MSIEIDGTTFWTATEVLADLGVSRQTLWRWRQEGKIPVGVRHRNRQVLFSVDEVEIIREFANHVEPIDETQSRQFKLFNGNGQRQRGSS